MESGEGGEETAAAAGAGPGSVRVAPENLASAKRQLIVHDALAFLALSGTSVALLGVTLFLFRSFQSHRADLAVLWSGRGRAAMQQGRLGEAVTALRTALAYAPDDEPDQLLLAQALANSGHTEEASNYFVNLWEARPGDGFLNLELARLARKKGEYAEAAGSYRDAISGSWEGGGLARRREVRLEFADFLTEQHQFSEARSDLMALADEAPGDGSLNPLIEQKLEAAGDQPDAQTLDEKTRRMLELNPPRQSKAGGRAKGKTRDSDGR